MSYGGSEQHAASLLAFTRRPSASVRAFIGEGAERQEMGRHRSREAGRSPTFTSLMLKVDEVLLAMPAAWEHGNVEVLRSRTCAPDWQSRVRANVYVTAEVARGVLSRRRC
jgi:hypothetical protein